jgi:hypothetical protein
LGRGRHGGLKQLGLLQVLHHLRQMLHVEDADSLRDRGFRRIV